MGRGVESGQIMNARNPGRKLVEVYIQSNS